MALNTGAIEKGRATMPLSIAFAAGAAARCLPTWGHDVT